MNKSEEIKNYRGAIPARNPYQGQAPRVLFVCTMGMLRSATAATLAGWYGINARACGVDPLALVPVSETLLQWADTVVCMDAGHKAALLGMEGCDLRAVKDSAVWSVPDVFAYMQPELQDIVLAELDKFMSAFEKARDAR